MEILEREEQEQKEEEKTKKQRLEDDDALAALMLEQYGKVKIYTDSGDFHWGYRYPPRPSPARTMPKEKKARTMPTSPALSPTSPAFSDISEIPFALSVLNGPFGSLVSTARQLVVVDVYSRV